jgi:sarcosine oxidase, subunit gamma
VARYRVTASIEAARGRVVLRGDTGVQAALRGALGQDVRFFVLGPTEALIETDLAREQMIAERLREQADGLHAQIVIVSDSFETIRVDGPDASAVLAQGCALDLAVMHPGAATRTLFAEITVMLHRAGPDRWELTVDRSLAGWLLDWLVRAAGADQPLAVRA